jgi:hypothetical protein
MSEEGRLIRVRNDRGDPKGVSYIVAITDKARALEIITSQAASPSDDIEDLGRVSEALIKAMHLSPGQFMPIDGIRHASQQQQQPQPKTDEKE